MKDSLCSEGTVISRKAAIASPAGHADSRKAVPDELRTEADSQKAVPDELRTGADGRRGGGQPRTGAGTARKDQIVIGDGVSRQQPRISPQEKAASASRMAAHTEKKETDS